METAGYVCRRYVRHDIRVLSNLEMPIALAKVAVDVDSQFQKPSLALDLLMWFWIKIGFCGQADGNLI